MAQLQQDAYVLHARPWRETSLLLECLTVDMGRLGVVARGARRRGALASQAELQVFQPVSLRFVQRGELATLRAAESIERPLLLGGDALLAGMYVNELVVRLSARQDPHRGLFELYGRTLRRLAEGRQLAWSLRRFERDLLAVLGYAMPLLHEAETDVDVCAGQEYLYLPEQGPVPAHGGPGPRVDGEDLRALAEDRMPDPQGLRRLRLLLRGVLEHHLGGRPLKSWQMLTKNR